MLKSILLRMLVFTLAFVVGVGSEAIFEGFQGSETAQSYRIVDPPIRLKVESSVGEQPFPYPEVRASLCNQSPYSIWIFEEKGHPYFAMQEWADNQWGYLFSRCFLPDSAQPVEVKPNSSVTFIIPTNWRSVHQRVGIQIFWERPELPTDELLDRTWPAPASGHVIWTQPFTIQYYCGFPPS